MLCPKCGGNIEGDGFTVVHHCEFVTDIEGVEPDASPLYCDYVELEYPNEGEE